MKLSELDKNFIFKGIESEDLEWFDRFTPAFSFDGCADLKHFWRLPVYEKDLRLPEGIINGYPSTGIRLRFRTDADRIAIRAKLMNKADMAIMARGGSHGFDLFVYEARPGDNGPVPHFAGNFRPADVWDEVSSEIKLPEPQGPVCMRDVLINFPLYNGVNEFFVGLPKDAGIEPPRAFSYEKPLVFYGSSITQGAAATRPQNAYTHMLAMHFDAPMINLGFSGRAKGEPEMARYIASLPMSVFVMDYDHNAETAEDLRKTHGPFFDLVRAAQPDLPIVIVSRPNPDNNWKDADERFEIIRTTYERARAAGDRRVWLVDGRRMFGALPGEEGFDALEREAATADGAHPTDLGFYRMYRALVGAVGEALQSAVK